MKAVQDGDREILPVNLDTGMYAINTICTHRGCRLSGGSLEGETVHCPCHGSAFNVRTGVVMKGPAKTPEPSYTVSIGNGEITIAF